MNGKKLILSPRNVNKRIQAEIKEEKHDN